VWHPAIPTLPLVGVMYHAAIGWRYSLNMLMAWVWQDAIPSYEKATLLDGKRGFFMCVCAMCVIRTDRRRHPHRPTQTSAPTDADIRIDRRRHPHRPTQTSAPTDADICTDRRRHPHRPMRMAFLLLYMRSGTSMPSSAMPFFSVLPTF
ncbi:hypothetical protein, partial [Leyella stercorea]|uniref:hypothetical protein n=1 Tax=Leyella stercorea TaxID=363265 RepID=UPI001C0F4C90